MVLVRVVRPVFHPYKPFEVLLNRFVDPNLFYRLRLVLINNRWGLCWWTFYQKNNLISFLTLQSDVDHTDVIILGHLLKEPSLVTY